MKVGHENVFYLRLGPSKLRRWFLFLRNSFVFFSKLLFGLREAKSTQGTGGKWPRLPPNNVFCSPLNIQLKLDVNRRETFIKFNGRYTFGGFVNDLRWVIWWQWLLAVYDEYRVHPFAVHYISRIQCQTNRWLVKDVQSPAQLRPTSSVVSFLICQLEFMSLETIGMGGLSTYFVCIWFE